MAPVLRYETEVLGSITRAQALSILQDHAFFMSVDPNLLSYTDVPPHNGALHALPAAMQAIQTGAATRCYEVTDRMPGVALFSKLLPGLSTTKIYYEFTDTAEGVFIFMRAPAGVTEERRWAVEGGGEREGDGGLRIVEYVDISCSRFLYGTIKGQQDQHWHEVHEKYVKKIGGEVGAQSAS